LLFPLVPDTQIYFSHKLQGLRDGWQGIAADGKRLGEQMSKKIGLVFTLVGISALSLLLSCGSSSSRPTGVVYVLTQGSNGLGNNVSSFSMDLNSGALSLVNSNASTCPTAATQTDPEPCGLPLDIVLDPSGADAFVLNQGTPCVQQGTQCVAGGTATILPTIYPFTVNSDGSLSQPGSPVYWSCVVQGATPCTADNSYADTAVAMMRDDAGQFLFVIDQGVYPPPTTCPATATAVTTAQQASDFLGCPSISVFTMSGSTSLTPVSQSATYQSPFFLSKTPSALSAIAFTQPQTNTPQELLFSTNNYDLCTISCIQPGGTIGPLPPNNNTVSVYSVSSTGVLSEQSNSPYAVPLSDPISVQTVNTNPLGQPTGGGIFIYVGQGGGAGSLTPFQLCTVQNAVCSPQQVAANLMVPVTCSLQSCDVSVGALPVQMAVDPTNNFLYGISEGAGQVFAFQINTTAGTLAALNPPNLPSQGSQPVSMAIHPSVNNTGQFLFVSNTSGNVGSFTLNTTSGAITNPLSIAAPAAPSGLAVH
jgi:hypothetical protein